MTQHYVSYLIGIITILTTMTSRGLHIVINDNPSTPRLQIVTHPNLSATEC